MLRSRQVARTPRSSPSRHLVRRLIGCLAAASALGLLPTVAGPPAPAAAADGACTDGTGVTVIIDFQELGGGTYTRCAADAPRTGFEALQQAGISYQTTVRFPGFLCKIAGKPGNDPCRDASPATAYWSYWVAPRGGRWCYSNFGAGNRTPPPGSVEGWSFALNRTASNTPAPRLAPPAPLPGVPPSSVPAGDCSAPVDTPTTTTSRPTTPTTAAPSTPGSPDPTTPAGDGGISGSPSGTTPDGLPITTTSSASTITRPGATTTTGAKGAGDQKDPASTNGKDPAAEGGARTGRSGGASNGDEEAAAARKGTVDLGDDGQSGGSPAALVVAIALVGAVGGAGAWRARRTRARAASGP